MQVQRPDQGEDPVQVRIVDHLAVDDHLLGRVDDDEAVQRASGAVG